MNIKRSLEQRLSGINKWSRVALMGISLLTAAASAQAYILTSDGCDPVAAGYVTVSLMSSNAAESRFHLSASGTNTSWKFTEWSFFDPVTYMAGYTPTSNPTRIIISNDVYGARATFKDITERYILTVLAGTGGTVDPSGTISNIVKDSTIPIAAFPASGYVFNGWTGVAGVADPASSNTTIRVSSQSTNALTANFLQRYSYTSLDPQGPGSGSIVTNMNSSTRYTAQPLEDPVRIPSDDTRRYACVGWSEGAGSGFPATGTNALYTISSVSSSFTNRWAWTNQYRLAVSASPGYSLITVGPYSFDALPQAVWFSENRIVKLSAVANSAYIFMGWILDGVSMPLGNGTLLVTNNSAHSVVAKFATPGADSDNDGLPDWWEAKFGLNATTYDATAVPPDPSGPDGDPDHDGLSNLAEFQIQYTNKNWYSSPVNADTDGDGMDDAYENSSVGPTNKAELTQQGQVVSAGLDCGGFIWTSGDNFIASNDSYSRENGPYGNRDADYHWSTNSGYQLKNVPLTNYEEWKGPDGRPPVLYVTVSFGQSNVLGVTTNLYPFSDDRGPVKMMVPNQPPFNTTDPDTHDQSKGNLADTDGDRIDDGYEWSWDKWQQANSGYNEIFIVGCTNGVPVAITNTVPDWNSARYFNPGFPADYNDSMPVGDILYDYKTAKVSPNWYTTSREYNAWQPTAFSSTIPAAPHSILMNNPPADDIAPQRSSHPFLIDVDQDGLPDGYEVIFGYDPWAISTFGTPWTDGQDNPDGDWMAWSGTNDIAARSLTNKWALRNHEVYLQDGFQPMVAVDMTYPKCPKPDKVLGKGTLRSPTTEKYSNIDEMRGPDGLMERVPEPMADDATSPINYDSDGDGIWDGWENYVGLNPSNPGDIALDPDKDKLSNLQEFQSYYTSSTNRMALTPLTNWMNKIFPTDPGVDPSPADTDTARGADTDGDGIKDGDEKTFFNGDTLAGVSVTNMTISVDDDGDSTLVETVYAYGAWVGTSFVGGGLNPASSDTDGDTLPDPYEASYAAGLDGTMGDAFKDPDGDGLQNYQEYWSCSVYHWQKSPAWQPDQADYDNADFFQGTPKKWDWSQRQYIPLFGPKIGTMGYAGAYPTEKDSDGDGMDDFYEIYHGLNPLFGTLDLVKCRDLGSTMAGAVFSGCDPFTQPWTAGHQLSDPDGDGLKNYEESPNSLYPSQSPRIHTDPTPLWMTDMNYDRSWVNLYYQPRVSVWYWAASPQPPPDYAFSFESNEGYDTDADGVSDKEELNVTKTDPLTPERPVKRRALYLPPGVPAYARTYPGFAAASSDPGGGYLPGLTMVTLASDALRSFTVEAWVRPLSPTSGTDQVVVERPLYIPPGNKMNLSPGLRLNFRLAISGDGKPYVSYTGDETEPIYGDPKVTAPMVLSTNWTHLAATYQVASYTNANQGGVLSLYVNGVLAVRSTFSQNPSTGSFYLGSPIVNVEGAPIVVGAADSNPNGTFGSTDEPMPSLFFKGWIDEVRVWDGARSVEQIQTTMRKQLKQSDVLAQQRPNPTLKYLYSFDGRPDVDHFATTTGTPLGFDVTAIKMFPASWMAAFWDATPQKSLVYSDYRYVPWIANIATHTPEAFPCDIGDSNLIQNVMSGTNVVGQYAEFWNTSNPYGSRYTTYRQWLGQRLDQFNDLLPLGYAQADEDAPMWDNGTVPALIPYDSDGDGMPDGWEEKYGMDPLVYQTGIYGPDGDIDGDGVSNINEYKLGYDPTSWDSLGNGLGDANQDSDGDGLANAVEQSTYLTDPSRADTDDDGVNDGQEVSQASDPISSVSPFVLRSLEFGASNGPIRRVKAGLLSAQKGSAGLSFGKEWTIECLVKPLTLPGSNVVQALVSGLVPDSVKTNINYELGIKNGGLPYVAFNMAGSTGLVELVGTVPLSTNEWTHLAGRLSGGILSLFVDGANIVAKNVNGNSFTGEVELFLGSDGFRGEMKEIRLWKLGRLDSEIDGFKRKNLLFGADSGDDGRLSVNGSGFMQETCLTTNSTTGAFVDELDTWTLEAWVKVAAGSSGLLIARANADNFNGYDCNYYMGINAQGKLVGRFAVTYAGIDGIVIDTGINVLTGVRNVADGQWHHVAYERSSLGTYLFIDGSLENRGPSLLFDISNATTAPNDLVLRKLPGPLVIGRGITGEMDEVRVWDHALSAVELKKYKDQNILGSMPGLVSYFNFDYQVGQSANDKAGIRDPLTEVGLYLPGATRVTTASGRPPVFITPLRSYAGFALSAYYPCDDGGVSLEDFTWGQDWLNDWSHAGVLVGDVRFKTVPDAELTSLADSDGDGIPSSWEVQYGFDPGSDVGVNGAWGDPDGDGLANIYEYYAGTNPRMADTDGDGFSDYDSRTNPGSRTWGELYDDGDGMPDLWEQHYNQKCATTGKDGPNPRKYDANLDPDEDGWDNYSEYMAGTDPLDHKSCPLPQVNLTMRYTGKLGTTLDQAIANNTNSMVRLSFYHLASMDSYPDAILNTKNSQFSGTSESFGGLVGGKTNDFDHVWQGNNYVFGYLDINNNNQWEPDSEPAGLAQNQPINIQWGSMNYMEVGLSDKMQGYPRFAWPAVPNVSRYIVTNAVAPFVGKIVSGPRNYWHEGDWLNTGIYGVPTGTVVMLLYTNEMPIGYFTNITASVSGGSLTTPIIVTPHDTVFSYARNDLEFKIDPNATSYRLYVATSSNGIPIVAVTNMVPYKDINGLSKVTLPFYAGDNYVPAGSNYPSSTWANGRYWVSVQAATPSASVSSPWSAVNLNVQRPDNLGAAEISGDVYYFGKVSHGFGVGATTNHLTIIVQAFESKGFSGVADGQVQITTNCVNSTIGGSAAGNTNNIGIAKKGRYNLMGLYNKTYYVRAFIDLNGNRQLDPWEPVGFVQKATSDGGFVPAEIDVSSSVGILKSGMTIVIRDRDTDGDHLPDGWEWMYYGTLSRGAYDVGVSNKTWWGVTNMTLLRCYEIDPVDVDPTAADGDTDKDGVSDFDEVCYSDRIAGTLPNIKHYDPYDPASNPHGTDLNPMKWDTDGDGLSDGYELDHGLNPLNPNDGAVEIARASVAGETIPGVPRVSQIAAVAPDSGQFALTWQAQVGMIYDVQYSDDLKTWLPALGLGTARYENGVYTYVDQSPKVATRFYRVVVR